MLAILGLNIVLRRDTAHIFDMAVSSVVVPILCILLLNIAPSYMFQLCLMRNFVVVVVVIRSSALHSRRKVLLFQRPSYIRLYIYGCMKSLSAFNQKRGQSRWSATKGKRVKIVLAALRGTGMACGTKMSSERLNVMFVFEWR